VSSLLDIQVALKRVVERFHEGRVVYGALGAGEDACKALVAVGEDVVVLVVFPRVEDGGYIKAVAIVGLFDKFVDKVSLEVDLIVAILESAQPAKRFSLEVT
jgi:hypothetical protein